MGCNIIVLHYSYSGTVHIHRLVTSHKQCHVTSSVQLIIPELESLALNMCECGMHCIMCMCTCVILTNLLHNSIGLLGLYGRIGSLIILIII